MEKKKLSEMSLEELWELFPIYLTEHNPQWLNWYEEELALLKTILPKNKNVRISHIGSTSIPTIWAKPIIDILLEVTDKSNFNEIKEVLQNYKYTLMSEEQNRISFNKGYSENGFCEKVYHLHLREYGDNDELYFCDYLQENIEVANEYETIKLKLWKMYKHNRDGYTESKTEFIKKITEKAKEKYKQKYENA